MDCPVSVMVLLRFEASALADCWLAMTPAGMDIMIAMEKPKAIITSRALIFLLEIFRTARLINPKIVFTSIFVGLKATKKEG
jgi:hypothetical protein